MADALYSCLERSAWLPYAFGAGALVGSLVTLAVIKFLRDAGVRR